MTPEQRAQFDAIVAQVPGIQQTLDDLEYVLAKKTGPGNNDIRGALIQSTNYEAGVAGWAITPAGSAEFNTGTFRGSLVANSIDIPDAATANSFHTNAAGDSWWGAAAIGDALAKILKTGAATFSNITVTGGLIAGWTTGADYIRDAANSVGMASTVTAGDDVRFWAGDTFVNRATAPFRVTEAGAVAASNFIMTGGSVASSVLNTSVLRATSDIVFTSTDNDTVAWSAGSIRNAAGLTYTISAGNTGNMTALTYIYLDTAISTTVLQITTTYSTAVGDGKILVATAQNESAGGAYCIPFLGGAPLLNGAAQINASSILAAQMSVSQLSALTANMGAITAGTITLDTAGYVRGGQTDYNTGTGFFLGYSGAAYKFSVGNPASQYVTWDGTILTIGGVSQVMKNFTAGETLVAGNAAYLATAGDGTDTAITQTTGIGDASIWANNNAPQQQDAQSFTTGANVYQISTILVRLKQASASAGGTVTVAIYETSGDKPTGSVLASATLPTTSLTTSFANYSFTLDCPVIPARVYSVVVNVTGNADSQHIVSVQYASSDVISGGTLYTSNDYGATWSLLGTSDLYCTITEKRTLSGSVYKTSALITGTSNAFIGFVFANAAITATAPVVISGSATGLSGITAGSFYYLSDTKGAVATSAGTVSRKVGLGLSTTEMMITNIW